MLKPKELNNENGYRYYSIDQLGIMQKILRLKDYGFSLDEIKPLLDGDDDNLSNAMMTATTPKQDLITEIYFPIEK